MNKVNKIILIIIILLVTSTIAIVYLYNSFKNDTKTDLQQPLNEIIEDNNELENQTVSENLEEKDTYNETKKEQEVYAIKDCDFYLYSERETDGIDEKYEGIKLLEYDNSNSGYAEIYFVFYDYTTEPSYKYTLEITDENGNSLLMSSKKEEQVIGGMVSKVQIEKLDLDGKITFSIFEKDYETEKIYTNSSTQIDLEQDLEPKQKIDRTQDLVSRTLGDVTFKCIYDEYEYFGTTTHGYSENLVGENCSLSVEEQYGSRFIAEEHIELSYEKNVNNLSLEDAFEKLKLINGVAGQYGLSDVYGMDITNQDEIIETIIINFEDMIDLCNGLTIEKEGKQYTKESFELYAEIQMIKDGEVEIGKGINCIKYHFESDENVERYMFIHNDNIYDIRVPMNERIEDDMKQFLDSLEILR